MFIFREFYEEPRAGVIEILISVEYHEISAINSKSAKSVGHSHALFGTMT